MILEKFNDFSNQIELETKKIVSKTDLPVVGVGEILHGNFMCLYTVKGKLYIKINEKVFDVSNNDFAYEYFHDKNITTFRLNKLRNVVLEINYPSWMLSDNIPAGFGLNDDEDEDFFAYLKMVLESENAKKYFLEKYFT